MKIIKQGDLDKKPVRELTCSKCNCEFSYQRHEIKKRYNNNPLSQLPLSQLPLPSYVECPNTGV
jgi:hypothetical protein